MAKSRRKDGSPGPAAPGMQADAGATRKIRKDGRVKTTQLLLPHLVKELAVVAGNEGRQRSQVVCDALDAYLPKFGVVRALRKMDVAAAAADRAGGSGTQTGLPGGGGEGAVAREGVAS